MTRVQSEYPYGDTAAQVAVFRALQRTGSVEAAAAELGLSERSVHKRLTLLYKRIGARNAIHASYLLAEAPSGE